MYLLYVADDKLVKFFDIEIRPAGLISGERKIPNVKSM